MSKVFFMVTMIGILALCSCSKTATTISGTAGYWSFSSNSFQAVGCTVNPTLATLTATTNATGNPYGNLVVSFYDSLPTVGGTYRVIYAGDAPGPKQVAITMAYIGSDTSIYYGSTGGTFNYPRDTVNVTVNSGKIKITASNVEVSTTTAPFDTIPLNFTLIQTQ